MTIYKSSEWSVFLYEPEAGSFILDFSQLNGSDVLGTYEGSLEKYTNAQIVSAVITDGSAVTQGINVDLQPQSLALEMQVNGFDLSDANKFLIGNRIIFAGQCETSVIDPVLGYLVGYFSGFIRSVTITVIPNTDIATINITASTGAEDLYNSLLQITKDTTTPRADLINTAINANLGQTLTTSFLTSDPYHYANTAKEAKTIGSWLVDLSQSALMPVLNSTFVVSEYGRTGAGALVTMPTEINTSFYLTLTDEYITEMMFDWSGAGSPTGVEYTLASDSAIVYQYGSRLDSGSLFNYILTADVKDLTELTSAGQKALTMTKKFMPVSVTVVLAKENQNVTYHSDNEYFPSATGDIYPTRLRKPGMTVYIDSDKYGFTGYALITGRTININYETMTVTYDLWKGFTS